jgi:hypothetical protein
MKAIFLNTQIGVHSADGISQMFDVGNTIANVFKLAVTKGGEKLIDHGGHEFWNVPGQVRSRELHMIKVCLDGRTERVSNLKASRKSFGH